MAYLNSSSAYSKVVADGEETNFPNAKLDNQIVSSSLIVRFLRETF